jgi:hypothetical protein
MRRRTNLYAVVSGRRPSAVLAGLKPVLMQTRTKVVVCARQRGLSAAELSEIKRMSAGIATAI